MAELDAAIEANASADLYLARVQVWLKRGAEPAAERDLDRAIELWPDRADLYLYRGIAALGNGQTRFAADNFHDAQRLSPDSMSGQLNLAIVQIVTDESRQARKDLDRLIATNSHLIEALRTRGALHTRLGDYPAALDDLTQSLSVRAGDSLALLLRGRVHVLSGNLRAVLADLRLIDPGQVDASQIGWAMGVAQFAVGQYGEAKERFTTLVEAGQNSVHAGILAYIAARRAGAIGDLIPAVPKGMELHWPREARYLFGGFGSEDEVRKTARRSDSAVRALRQCEATFYVASWLVLQGRKSDALRGFDGALEDCAADDLFRAMAVAEVDRLR